MNKVEPGLGEESVWHYPRPPKLEDCSKLIQIIFNDVEIAHSEQTMRVLETSHPPVYYIPQLDISMEYLQQRSDTSFCEWKGRASYFDLTVGDRSAKKAAWAYANPTDRFKPIANYLAFYAHKMDSCYVDGEKVNAQRGGFYGGWITSEIVGPFKGEPGSAGW
jgi:uncharacterized protein (DUF427 family)